MTERKGMVLGRWHPDDRPEDYAEGSKTLDADCGHKCWLAPSGATFLLVNPSTFTVCGDCAGPEVMKRIKAAFYGTTKPGDPSISIVPGALDEIGYWEQRRRGV